MPQTPPKKAKVVKSLGKVIFLVFMNRHGVLLSHTVLPGEMINLVFNGFIIMITIIIIDLSHQI